VFFTRGISLTLFIITLACLAYPALRSLRRQPTVLPEVAE
jgi:hypothetical protein